MSPFISDILFLLATGAILAPTLGLFIFDAERNLNNTVKVKHSVIAGIGMFFAPTIIYLVSYVFFSIL